MRILGLLSAAVILSSCMSAEERTEQRVRAAFTANYQESPAGDGFRSNETLRSDDGRLSRVGDLPDGLYYSYSVNPSSGPYGFITTQAVRDIISSSQIWGYSCVRDRMTDATECTIRGQQQPSGLNNRFDDSLGVGVAVYFYSRNGDYPHKMCVAEHDFPGRSARARINGGTPFSLGESGCTTSSGTIQRMLSADSLVVESVKWPWGNNYAVEVDMRGAPEIIELLQYDWNN